MSLALIIVLSCGGTPPCLEGYVRDSANNCVVDDSYTGEGPLWTTQKIEAEVFELLELGIPEPLLVREIYLDAMYSRDVDCPFMETPGQPVENPVGAWSSDCVASSGWQFDGGAIYEEDGVIESGEFRSRLVSSFGLTSPAGDLFSAGGEFVFGRSAEGVWDIQMGGVYRNGGETGWFGERSDTALWYTISGEELVIEGGLSNGSAGLHFHGMSYGLECSSAPFGDVSVRDDIGRWYRISFDSECDGCGDVSLSGEELGRACVSLSESVGHLIEQFGEAL